MLIAVSMTRYPRGVDEPKKQFPRGFNIPDSQRAVNERTKQPIYVDFAYEVMSATSMLQRTFHADAHFVDYIFHNGDDRHFSRQPRCNKDGLEWAQKNIGKLWFSTLTFDVDNPNHTKWESDDEARAFVSWCAEKVPSAMVYATSAGCRIMQPLARRVHVEQAEGALSWWYEELIKLGINPDETCLDWTRNFRAANVRRDDKPYKSPAIKFTSKAIEPNVSAFKPFTKRPTGPKV